MFHLIDWCYFETSAHDVHNCSLGLAMFIFRQDVELKCLKVLGLGSGLVILWVPCLYNELRYPTVGRGIIYESFVVFVYQLK